MDQQSSEANVCHKEVDDLLDPSLKLLRSKAVQADEATSPHDDPFCSVLNTVVDYAMINPTPLEADEYREYLNEQQQQSATGTHGPHAAAALVQVPVLRIFGPIVRRDRNADMLEPHQSACLHIHGAFPYMLARPTLAGPDGSLHRSSHHREDGLTPHDHVDWDDVTGVERVLPFLKETLEAAIQSSMEEFANNKSNAESASVTPAAARPSVRRPRIIRQLSVQVGRGFYTYCPGPPAPFVKIEYYDPRMRWRVKRILERGLDVPPLYHPDPVQYDDLAGAAQEEPSPVGLTFHCYEAHIPLTMQFFKDYNLAGMSYVHLARPRFRHPLPVRQRQRWGARQEPVNKSILLLRDNVLEEFTWKNDSCNCRRGKIVDVADTEQHFLQDFVPEQQISSQTSSKVSSQADQPSHDWIVSDQDGCGDNDDLLASFGAPSKETTCDVELDVTVQDILNVYEVMTELPDDWDERQAIHWRAVPSLREIWKEERRRMAKLLPPENDFLSNPPEETLTLNVKKESPVPGTRLAVEGMRRLLNVSSGLEENFRRAMKEVVDRHDDDVSKIDALLRKRYQERSAVHSTPASEDILGIAALTPTNDEVLGALEGLNFAVQQSQNHSPTSDDGPLFSRSGQGESDALLCSNTLGQTLSAGYTESQENWLNRAESGYDDNELSQRVDRGDGLFSDKYEFADEYIDPETLRPYEEFEEDEDDGNDVDELGVQESLALSKQSLVPDSDCAGCETNNQLENVEAYDHCLVMSSDDDETEKLLGENGVSRNLSQSQEAFVSAVDARNPHVNGNVSASTTVTPWQHKSPVEISLSRTAPVKRDLRMECSSVGLHPMGCIDTAPVWLKHMSKYEELSRLKQQVTGPSCREFAARLTRPAPTAAAVSAWLRSQRKRKLEGTKAEEDARNCKLKPLRTKIAAAISVTAGKDPKTSPVNDNDLRVEEIQWQRGDGGHLSMTQHSEAQNDQVAAVCNGISADECASGADNIRSDDFFFASTSGNSDLTNSPYEALKGVGNQGGRLMLDAGGELKAKTRPSQGPAARHRDAKGFSKDAYIATPVSMMVIEVHVQCRTGRAGVNDSKVIALTPNADRDRIFSVAYLYGKDPGGGEPLQTIERGYIVVPSDSELKTLNIGSADKTSTAMQEISTKLSMAIPKAAMDCEAPLVGSCALDERQLLLRLSSIVYSLDPDLLVSWDTQGAGLGYIIERGAALDGKAKSNAEGSAEGALDMARLLGRTRGKVVSGIDNKNFGCDLPDSSGIEMTETTAQYRKTANWKGSGLGNEWDERVGAGAAAASISGRLVFAGWKLVAEEVKHPNASYLNAMVSAVLEMRIPFHDNLRLTQWYSSNDGRDRWRVIHHKLTEATACLLLFDALDIVGRAGEAARLSGVEFHQSFPGIRGSQYKVEGVLLRALRSLNSDERGLKKGRRIASASLSEESKSQTQSPWKGRRFTAARKDKNDANCHPMHELNQRSYFFYSPSLADTNRQEALEVQALTLEPQSGHQVDPVVVCDFTALYPSIVIAYNLCYSTCAGRLDYHSTRPEMKQRGKTTGRLGPFRYTEGRTATVLRHHYKSLVSPETADRAYVAPTGTIYVAESVVKGVLPQVLDEMLSTRAMLKKASKEYKKRVINLAPSILRQLEARQLALKYVANVTYGYTSATFSGRCAMPLLADTIVECGRRTLTNAINLANAWGKEKGKWKGCEVLYGDTDSLFIRLPGRSVQEAFDFGEELCKIVTSLNPPPVQLKLEKVYLGSILQTKKKYCGMKFESKFQRKPTFEAKGIETVRRDQCALTQKILRNSLVMLFKSGIDAVRAYLERQWTSVLSGALPISDFVLTGRVREKYRGGRIGPVQAVLARRLAEADPGRVVRHKERLAYVIVATPGVAFRLKDCVLTPIELLEQWDAYTIHTAYYITRHVNAALQRCFGLAPHKANITSWYDACPKPRRRVHFWPITRSGSSVMISSFFGSDICSLCGKKCRAASRSRASVCMDCRQDTAKAHQAALTHLNQAQTLGQTLGRICSDCNLCHEDGSTFAVVKTVKNQHPRSFSVTTHQTRIVTPLANCTCIDCPITFERHRVREAEIEAQATCEALEMDGAKLAF